LIIYGWLPIAGNGGIFINTFLEPLKNDCLVANYDYNEAFDILVKYEGWLQGATKKPEIPDFLIRYTNLIDAVYAKPKGV
jgi:hypothetical protein